MPGGCKNFIQLLPSGKSSPGNGDFVSTTKNPLKN